MRTVFGISAVGLLVTASLSAQRPAPSGQSPTSGNAPTRLELHQPIERDLHGGETHFYLAQVEAGQFVHVVTVQKGIDVSVTLLSPSGKQILVVDSLNGSYGPEPVSIIAEDSGDLRLDVSALSPEAPAGHYQIELRDLRAPTPPDRVRIKAEQTYAEGCVLYSRGGVESLGAAAAKWGESFALWQSLDDQYGQALSLYNAGAVYATLGERQKALVYYIQALPLERAVGNRAGEATTLSNIGAVYDDLGEKQKALDFYTQALPLRRAVGDRAGEATTLNNIGLVYSDLGEQQKAVDYYTQALPLNRAVGDRKGEATTLNNIGRVYAALGEQPKALDFFTQALPLWRAGGDRKGEATTLSNIGAVYDALGEKQKALEYYTQALPLRRAVGDRKGEATTLTNIGAVYADLGEKQKALDFFTQALPLRRAVEDRAGEATTLSNIGAVYDALGEKQKALDFFTQALPLRRAVEDRNGEATTLSNIGAVYAALGEKQKALEYYTQVLPLWRAVGNRNGEATTLSNIGAVYADLGEKQKALEYYTQALPLRRAVGDRDGEASTLHNIGAVYADLGEKQKALEYYTQALALSRAVGDRNGEATTLHNIGAVYSALGEKQKALEYYTRALALERAVEDRNGEATTLSNIGAVYADLGEKPKALDFYTQALPLFRAVQDPLGEANTLTFLMEYWKRLQHPSLAILFGKQAIDRFQQVRRNIRGLEKDVQQSFVKSNETSYRELADLLVSQGRLPEAQEVLDRLKLEEYDEYRHRRGLEVPPVQPVIRTRAEEAAVHAGDVVTADLVAAGEAYLALQRKTERTPDEQARYAALDKELEAANKRFQQYLRDLYTTFSTGDRANADRRSTEQASRGLQTLLRGLGPGTVAIYTLVLDQKCTLIVITPATMVAREVAISQLALRTQVADFVGALRQNRPVADLLPQAQALYQLLLAPIENDLAQAHATTLVWSLSDVLRYVPLAALHDGHQYVAERFATVVITTSAVNMNPAPTGTWRGLAMGVSKSYEGLAPLTAVPGELNAVVTSPARKDSHGPLPGTILLNDAFTEPALEAALGQPPALVHIATHFVLNAGDDERSYLLLGGQTEGGAGTHLSLADLRDKPGLNNWRGVELVTLSACETAVVSKADGREVDSLGIVAQDNGAKAVLATLWPVDDASVGLLMERFYRLWVTAPGLPKAEALRQAQLGLLHGCPNGCGPAGRYASPYYWAPFVLMGNWK
jgi:CHAT domain-containing protein/Flp pilus assembly protein TadD